MKLYILVFVCNVGQPVCDQSTARVYQALIAPEGIIVCPASVPVIQSAVAPGPGEYIRTRCELKQR